MLTAKSIKLFTLLGAIAVATPFLAQTAAATNSQDCTACVASCEANGNVAANEAHEEFSGIDLAMVLDAISNGYTSCFNLCKVTAVNSGQICEFG
jgi:hypothetical protein